MKFTTSAYWFSELALGEVMWDVLLIGKCEMQENMPLLDTGSNIGNDTLVKFALSVNKIKATLVLKGPSLPQTAILVSLELISVFLKW